MCVIVIQNNYELVECHLFINDLKLKFNLPDSEVYDNLYVTENC
jgi:hypothetical protein